MVHSSIVWKCSIVKFPLILEAVYCPPAPRGDDCEQAPSVHLVVFDSSMRASNVYLQVSAKTHGFNNLVVLGAGEKTHFGHGMEVRLAEYRRYVQDHEASTMWSSLSLGRPPIMMRLQKLVLCCLHLSRMEEACRSHPRMVRMLLRKVRSY